MLDTGHATKVEMERVWTVLDEMLTLFYPPFRAETDDELMEQSLVALRRYVAVLSQYDRQTLEKGWTRVIENHKTERWPVIGVIDAECRGLDPQRRTAGSVQPGELKGRDYGMFPTKARPDFSYEVEKGIRTEEQARRLMDACIGEG